MAARMPRTTGNQTQGLTPLRARRALPHNAAGRTLVDEPDPLPDAGLLDPTKTDLEDGVSVLIEGSRIREVYPRPIRTSGAAVVDVGGRTLMPGLIDCQPSGRPRGQHPRA